MSAITPLLVNVYDVAEDGTETLTAENVTLIDVFPDGNDDEDIHQARHDLRQSGRYWGGGGAAPRFLLMRVRT